MMTIKEYIETVKESNDVMSLAKQLKKQNMSHSKVEGFVDMALEKLKEVNAEEYNRYVSYVGCHKGIKDGYECMEHRINCNHGGSIAISDWIDVESANTIGSIHISNGWGMGMGDSINSIKDIDKQIEGAKKITWINDKEREFLIEALENLKR